MKKLTLLLIVVILLTACQPAVTPQPTVIPPTDPPAPAPTEPPVKATIETPIVVATNQPPSTPTLAPNESLTNSADDLIGTWWFTQASVMVEIKADGTYRVYAGPDTLDEGDYMLDAGKLTWVTGHPTCYDKSATYEAYLIKQDGKPIWLRMQVVGSDPCHARADVLASKAKLQNP
jgi:hypothetical protein